MKFLIIMIVLLIALGLCGYYYGPTALNILQSRGGVQGNIGFLLENASDSIKKALYLGDAKLRNISGCISREDNDVYICSCFDENGKPVNVLYKQCMELSN